MRLFSVERAGRRYAAVRGPDGLHLLPDGISVEQLVAAGIDGARTQADSALAGPPVPPGQLRALPPIEPPSFRDFMTFAEHVSATAGPAGVSPEWHTIPTFYFSNPATFFADGDDVPVSPESHAFDFELEVGAVVSGDVRDVPAGSADEHLFGLTILNDWSARDLQSVEMRIGLGPAKGKDGGTSMGPCLVTMDEFGDARLADGRIDLEMSVRLNGEVVGTDSLANMSWTFADLLAYASRGTRVRSGDVLGSGTCGNGGCLLEGWGSAAGARRTLVPGDEVILTVERIGSLRNTVTPAVAAHPVRPALSPGRPVRRRSARPAVVPAGGAA
jgi:2-keto-4-pentenoate hydratase/2-oxohepta-3-ene-1,7-dioic acid hydratase in catechol pathway